MHKFFTENGATYGLCRLFSRDAYSVENAISIGTVSAKLQEVQAKRSKGIFIGVIDKDKRKPPFLETFIKVSDEHGVILKQLDNLYLIALDPAVDRFIFTNADDVSVDVSKYKFNKDLKKFISGLKTQGIDTKPEFRNLLNDLKQKNCSCFVALQKAFDHIYNQQ